jgi:hypothetical protein
MTSSDCSLPAVPDALGGGYGDRTTVESSWLASCEDQPVQRRRSRASDRPTKSRKLPRQTRESNNITVFLTIPTLAEAICVMATDR